MTITTHTSSEVIAADLHQRALVIDAIAPQVDSAADWRRYADAGVNVISAYAQGSKTSRESLHVIAWWYAQFREAADELVHVRTVDDIRQAVDTRRLGVFLHFQNSLGLDGEPRLLELYHQLGIRMMGICYNTRGWLGDGCYEPSDAGLSRIGRDVVAEIQRLGILLDLSHTGERTALEAIDLVDGPVVVSHANPKARCSNDRNVSDDLIRAVAATGGVVGVVSFPPFVSASSPTLRDLVDHIEYLIDLVGVDHVGVGNDFYRSTPAQHIELRRTYQWDPVQMPAEPQPFPEGIRDASEWPNITTELVRRGLDHESVSKILGTNWLRVFQTVWK